MDAFDLWAMAPNYYGEWDSIAAAMVLSLGLGWVLAGFPGIPRTWLNDDWRQ